MSIEILSKRCTKCGEVKPVSDFYREKRKVSGYHSHCKVCHKAQTVASRALRREEMGEEAWLAHQRELVARSRERRQMSSERSYSKAKSAAVTGAHRPSPIRVRASAATGTSWRAIPHRLRVLYITLRSG